MKDPTCPHCEMEVGIDFDEPGEWCSNDHMPDGSFDMKCGFCSKKVRIEVDWSPRFYVEEIEE